MAEFITVMKEFTRMCGTVACMQCGVNKKTYNSSCIEWARSHPEEAEKIIMDWAAEHPVETMKDRFFKMFPDAMKTKADFPRCCPSHLGWTEDYSCGDEVENCEDCWNRPYKEKMSQKESK